MVFPQLDGDDLKGQCNQIFDLQFFHHLNLLGQMSTIYWQRRGD